MKSFEDFMLSITGDVIEQISDDATLKAKQLEKPIDNDLQKYFGNQVAAIAFTISLELLGLYHKWLEQQL